MIRKVRAGYELLSRSGKRLGGPYPTVSQAVKREAQVRHFKQQKAKEEKR